MSRRRGEAERVMTNADIEAHGYEVVWDGSIRTPGTPIPAWQPAHPEPESHQGRRTEDGWREEDAILKTLFEPTPRSEIRAITGMSQPRVNRVLQRLIRAGRVVAERRCAHAANTYRRVR